MDFSTPGIPGIAAIVPGKLPATSMKYHEMGKRLFVASESRLQIIDCLEGKGEVLLRNERENITLVEPTHHDSAILMAGKGSANQQQGQRHAISYWSLHDNKILRKFRGHSDRVTNLSTCPANDTFLSSSDDGFVRLWNIQQAGCLAQLELPKDATAGSPLACFDATGLVFCATAQMSDKKGQYVHLYDARNYAAGAFAEFKLNQGDFEAVIQTQLGLDAHRAGVLSQSAFRSVTFNVSGEQILVGAENGLALVIDGFDGTIKRAFMESSKTSVQPAVVAFTPDDKTVLFGNENGSVTCYDVTNGAVIKTLESHNARVNCIAANPKYTQIASSCTQTALWMW